MVNKIITGISVALDTAFGGAYPIFADVDLEQGVENNPCFFIAAINPSRRRLVGDRFMGTHPFDVHYFPTARGMNTEMHTIAMALYQALELITLPNGDLLRGTRMQHETVDSVLHFFVNYNMPLIETAEQDPMEDIAVTTGLTEG